MAENQSLAFQRDCILYDMNGDGFVSILGDVPCFVDFVFFSIDQPNPVCAGEVPCACDGNQDGFCSIIGDVPGFVDCLFFNQCSEPANASVEAGDTARRGFTVGGAVYADRDNPLTSGVEGVAVELLDASGDSISSTTTGRFGIWKLEALPTGTYSVVFESVNGDGSLGMVSRTIAVAERNKVAMQSIQLHLPEESQRQEPQRRKVRRNSRR